MTMIRVTFLALTDQIVWNSWICVNITDIVSESLDIAFFVEQSQYISLYRIGSNLVCQTAQIYCLIILVFWKGPWLSGPSLLCLNLGCRNFLVDMVLSLHFLSWCHYILVVAYSLLHCYGWKPSMPNFYFEERQLLSIVDSALGSWPPKGDVSGDSTKYNQGFRKQSTYLL